MPTPAEVLATDAETLRGTGMSYAKAAYLHDLPSGDRVPDLAVPAASASPTRRIAAM